MNSLREEILGVIIQNDNNGSLISGLYGKVTDEILEIFEKRIDKFIREYEDYDESNVTKALKKEMLQ